MKKLKKAVSLFVLGIILGAIALPVFATALGPWGYYGPQMGYSYKNQSYISGSNPLSARARVITQDYSYAPTGYMGVNAWLYKNDILVATSGWVYNPSASPVLINGTSNYSSSGDYYADGQTKAYNGNGYYTYGVFSSPIVQIN